ncbi:hypothetical protein GNIT_0006 [Glaciecola nitratireducens FR1064]|uniref:Uncharacterized protein n=1 Tax=Glaciecola nitratireducens (strain JCM 12485 / KCTC 12276 / FR1064) TaxID=1085623 RepID=G4QED8_GLANF|nr:hypothetical protein GNIT_0006 [Glaciecola nitratireducens FR1064]
MTPSSLSLGSLINHSCDGEIKRTYIDSFAGVKLLSANGLVLMR